MFYLRFAIDGTKDDVMDTLIVVGIVVGTIVVLAVLTAGGLVFVYLIIKHSKLDTFVKRTAVQHINRGN